MLAGGPVTMCVCACVCSGINMLTRDPVTIRVCARVHVCTCVCFSLLFHSFEEARGKYSPNTMSRQQKSLLCIAPLLTTVEETLDTISAQVRGHIPEWLNGSLLRVGPGKFEFGKDK